MRHGRTELTYVVAPTCAWALAGCGSGLNGWGEEEKHWAQGWRYSNHNSAAFDRDLNVVTEHGWCWLWSHHGGHEPAMVAG